MVRKEILEKEAETLLSKEALEELKQWYEYVLNERYEYVAFIVRRSYLLALIMEKITVKVCLGTTCFVMGGSNLQELNDIIPKKYGDKVEVSGSPCLGLCSINWEYSKAPYVKVDDEVIAEATVEKVMAEIAKKVNQ